MLEFLYDSAFETFLTNLNHTSRILTSSSIYSQEATNVRIMAHSLGEEFVVLHEEASTVRTKSEVL